MNDYRYWLCMNEKKLRGCFFSDPDFGFYFFTEPTSLDLSWNRFVDLTIHQQKVTVCSNSTNHFEVYRLEQNGQKVYAFALVEKWLMPTLQYLTFDDLSSSGIGLSSEELLKLFAQICILPTGNFTPFWNRPWESSARRGPSGSMWTAPPPTAILTGLPGGSLSQQTARS